MIQQGNPVRLRIPSSTQDREQVSFFKVHRSSVSSILIVMLIVSMVALAFLGLCSAQDYEVPEPEIEVYYPKGFRVSIPDEEGVSLFAVHINFNKEMEGKEAGEIARDITRKKNGRWSYTNKDKRLKTGDVLNFWLYVIKDRLGYELNDQSYVVRDYAQPTEPTPVKPPHEQIDVRVDGCQQTETTVNGKPGCRGHVIFYRNFTEPMDLIKGWSHVVSFSDSPETNFVALTSEFGTTAVKDNKLVLEPKLLEDISNASYVKTGTMKLNGCTSQLQSECSRTGFSWAILPPILTGRMTTKDSFSFKYGVVEIKAKLPSGDWIVPELWLEPKEKYYKEASGRLYLGLALGNPSLKANNGEDLGNTVLSQGYSIDWTKTRFFKKHSNTPWSSTYHTYKLVWTSKSLKFYVDDVETDVEEPRYQRIAGGLSSNSLIAPFDREFYINVGMHVGGGAEFPDGAVSGGKPKPWDNGEIKRMLNFWRKKDDWYPTWQGDDKALQIEYIRVSAV